MRIARFWLAIPLALVSLQPAQARDSADRQLQALGDAYYRSALEQYGDVELSDGTTRPGDRLPSATPASNLAAAEREKAWLARLDAIPPDQLSPAGRINASVLRTLLREGIE